jgi:hypothetical protein
MVLNSLYAQIGQSFHPLKQLYQNELSLLRHREEMSKYQRNSRLHAREHVNYEKSSLVGKRTFPIALALSKTLLKDRLVLKVLTLDFRAIIREQKEVIDSVKTQ